MLPFQSYSSRITPPYIHVARGYLLCQDIMTPSSSLRHVCDEDRDMPAPSPAVASGGAGSRSMFPLHPNPAAPSAVCLQHGRSAAQTDFESQRSEGSAIHVR